LHRAALRPAVSTDWAERAARSAEATVSADPTRSGVTLRQYSEAWLAERTVRGRPQAVRTRETYQHSLDRWVLPALGHLQLDRIIPAAVRRWHAQISAITGPTATR
jgi:hypothetical protein